MDPTYTLLTFALAGVFLKLADDYGEEGNSLLGYAAAFTAAGLFWLLIKVDQYTSAVMLAVVVGCIASLKVDRWNLIAGLILLAVLMGAMGFEIPALPPLITLAAAAYLDEASHDRHWKRQWIKRVFRYRPLLKGLVVLLAALGLLSPLSAVGLIVFDISYDSTGVAIRRGKSTDGVGGTQPIELRSGERSKVA
jgi:hypothetical protein